MNADYPINNEASFMIIAADLEKSIDPYDRALARAIKKILPVIVQHSKEELAHWKTVLGFEKSLQATMNCLGTAIFLTAVGACQGDVRKRNVIAEQGIKDAAANCIHQLRQSQEVAPLVQTPITPPAN